MPNDIEQFDDPAKLSSEARLREIARILAVGYLRLRSLPTWNTLSDIL